MAIKDLLVHVDIGKACKARVDAAFGLAATHGAHLTGLYIDAAIALPTYSEGMLVTTLTRTMDQLQAEQEIRREWAKVLFEESAARSDAASDWRSLKAGPSVSREPVSAIVAHGRHADLVMVGQSDPDDTGRVPGGLAGRPVMELGRPVLVGPYTGAPKPIGRRVLVACKSSREAARAVNDALPILERAESVHVMTVNRSDQEEPDGELPAAADISLHLARHHVSVEAHKVVVNDMAVGDILLSRAADLFADLIVMGAYGHSRLRELVLGGTTRHLLHHMTVPVLMSH